MQVIEAQRASILEPHDHLHINQISTFVTRAPMHKAWRTGLRGRNGICQAADNAKSS
jgi:hypothetical protein